MADVTKDQVFEFIDNMTILQMSGFIKEFEERYGVTAAAPMAMMGAAPAAAAAVEEQTEFNVILSAIGDKKIQVIKAIREITGLGLKEAKDLVDGAPSEVKAGVSKEEADKMKATLEEQGASVEIK